MSRSPKKSAKKEDGGAQPPSDDIEESVQEAPPILTQDAFPIDLMIDGEPVATPAVELTAPLTPEQVEQMAKPLMPALGKPLCVFSPRHNRSFMKQAARDIREGRAKTPNCIKLPDGQEIQPGPTYMTTDSPELQALIRAGVVMAGSKPRGKRARGLAKQLSEAVE